MIYRGTVRNMQSFIPKINLRNQCIQFGFIIRIYHDARSPELQRDTYMFGCVCVCVFRCVCLRFYVYRQLCYLFKEMNVVYTHARARAHTHKLALLCQYLFLKTKVASPFRILSIKLCLYSSALTGLLIPSPGSNSWT